MKNWLRMRIVRWLALDVNPKVWCPCDECISWRRTTTPHQARRPVIVLRSPEGHMPTYAGPEAADRSARTSN